MAIAAAGKIAPQRVILVWRRQLIAGNQQIKNDFEFSQTFTSFASQFDILFELRCAAERSHKPKSA